jgi:hypothetical protein
MGKKVWAMLNLEGEDFGCLSFMGRGLECHV